MADIDAAFSEIGDARVITWATLTSANSAGEPMKPIKTEMAIAAVQFTGTFDSATTVLQGSNDGANWVTLTDTLGSAISFTAAGYAELSTAMAYIRPSTSGGGGSQDIDCVLVARG